MGLWINLTHIKEYSKIHFPIPNNIESNAYLLILFLFKIQIECQVTCKNKLLLSKILDVTVLSESTAHSAFFVDVTNLQIPSIKRPLKVIEYLLDYELFWHKFGAQADKFEFQMNVVWNEWLIR